MNSVTANELKTRGISAVEEHLDAGEEVLISVRGKNKYVVMNLEKYDQLRECELESALREARADYDSGKTVSESVEDHLRRVTDGL
jgi:PHD/YefM family antitoxin component YafN of YafNO toxin-antitoxin module